MIKYKTIKVRCWPILKETEEVLNRTFQQVRGFMEISLTEFRKGLYHAVKESGTELPMRTVALLAKRFGDTVLKNEIIPMDEGNTFDIVKNEHGYYSIQGKIIGNRQTETSEEVTIPISRSDNDYYGDIIDGWKGPIVLFRQAGQIFAAINIPIEMHCRREMPAVFIGIDLNMQKDAASLYNPATGKYEKNTFFDRMPVSKTFDEYQKRISTVTDGLRKTDWTDDIRKQVREIYRKRSAAITTSHGNFIRELIDIADLYVDDQNVIFVLEDLKGINTRVSGSASFNTWLNAKWCFGRFGELLETKGYPVIKVYPFNTSKNCHICGGVGETYGYRERLFRCDTCGMVDFNRDLNAARNIALRGHKYINKRPKR